MRGPRSRRPWLRPKRVLIILATLVVVLALAGAGLYFDLNSKLSRVDVLAPAGFTSAGTNWPIAGSDSRGGLLKSLLSKMTSTGTLINPFAVIPAAGGAASSLTVDQGTSLSQLASVAFALKTR